MKELSLYETRIIGALIEKSLTTPDQYPLSLNALTSACNQKSNRDPVLELAESTVLETVNTLIDVGLVAEVSGSGSRVVKYKHRFCNTEFSEIKLNDKELAIVCVMFLRGPQTPGELRTRTARLCEFKDMQDVEFTLHRLMKREDQPVVERLPREVGKRESRYRHLFSGEAEIGSTEVGHSTRGSEPNAGLAERVETLESKVSELEDKVRELYDWVDQLTQ